MGESLTLRPTRKSSSSAKALNPGINMEMQQKIKRVKHGSKESLIMII